MKKAIVVLLIFILFITGCKANKSSDLNNANGKENVSEWLSLKSKDDLFSITVFINKFNFKAKEKIELFSTVEYIGEKDEIDTWSGRPNFKYTIFDGTDYYCEDMQLDVLEMTTFKKGEVYNYPFKKSGGWSEDDPKADYWKTYYSDPELRLPTGTYEIRAFCDFSFNDTVPFDEYNQEIKFEITVE
jgi:hypothetical protein